MARQRGSSADGTVSRPRPAAEAVPNVRAPAAPGSRICSVEEAAEHLGVSVRYVRRLIAERRIRHIKVGHYIRFAREDLDDFLAAGVREAVQR